MSNEASFHARITADAKQFVAEMQGAAAALATLVQQAEAAGKTASKKPSNEGAKAVREIKDAYSTASKEQERLHSEAMQDIAAENRARTSRGKGQATPGLGGKYNAPAIPALPEGTNLAALAGVRMNLDQMVLDSKKKVAREDAEFNRLGLATMRQRDAEEAKSTRARIAMNRMHGAAFREDAARQMRAQQQQMDAMVTGRYALYDQASGYELIARKAAMLTAAMASTVVVAAQFESAFTSVERAMQPLPDEIQGIRDSLLQMSTELPIAFSDMSKIATLGAQMGITASGIEEFTQNVSAFSAITGSTIDETAQKFGRIAALAGISAQDFNKLGSAVAFTGINAVATEQEILALTESIAAATKNAGFAADEIIGFSTTLASLGIAPEQARGVVLRVFADITRAVDTGGQKLEQFGKIAGMSASQAAEMWKNSPEEYFNALLSGLGTVENFTKAMDSLGFTETRETNVLQRLAQNMAIYNKSMQDSKKSYEEGTFLADAYAKTADNLEAKFKMLMNTLSQLGDAIGSGLIGPMGILVDSFKDAADAATGFFKSPIGSFITPITTGITALIAGFAAFRAVQIKTIAQLFAMRTAMIQLGRAQEGTKNAFGNATLSLMNLQRAVTMSNGQVKFLTRSQYENALANMKVAGAIRLTTGETVILTKAEYDLAVAEGKVAAGAMASSSAINGWSQQTKAAAVYSRAMTVAMGAIGWVGAAVGAISMIGLLTEMNKVTLDLTTSGGGLASFRDAIYEDTKAVADGAEYFGKYSSKVVETDNVAKSYVSTLESVSGGQTQLNSDLTDVNKKITEQTLYLGENSQAWLANAIANDESIIAMFKKMEESGQRASSAIQGLGIDFQEMQKSALAKPGSGALDYIKATSPQVRSAISEIEKLQFELAKQGSMQSFDQIAQTMASTGTGAMKLAAQMYVLALGIDNTTKEGVQFSRWLDFIGVLTPTVTESTDDYSASLDKTSKSLRTVVDYASDLASVFSRMTEIKFGRQEALDKVAAGWNNIAEKAASAAKAMDEANQSRKEAEATKAILEYQLSVANRYGDEKRALIIRAKLAKVDDKIAEETTKAADAQAELSKSTKDSSKNSIENRAALLELFGSYQGLIEVYAKTGLKGQALKDKITELSIEFANNARKAGFAEEDITDYGKAFDGLKTTVTKMPREVDIEFKSNVSAATQAVNEYLAKLNATKGTFESNISVKGAEKLAVLARIEALQTRVAVLRQRLAKNELDPSSRREANNHISLDIAELRILEAKAKGFSSGGYVSGAGSGTSDSIPGMLSNGEFVMRASAVNSYGLDFMNAINQQRVAGSMPSGSTAAASGSSSSVVYLSPDDRALLRAAIDRPIALYTDNQKIAASANAGNVILAQRGSN